MGGFDLVLLGGGSFAREAFVWALQSGLRPAAFHEEHPKSQTINGVPVVGMAQFLGGKHFVVAVGDVSLKKRLWSKAIEMLMEPHYSIVHPKALLGHEVHVAPGGIICPGVIVTTDVVIGKGVILNLNVTVGHDCRIEDFVTISPGANISGRCTIKEGAYVGSNAVIREGLTIGRNAVVGMGAVVTKDVPDDVVVMGNPARKKGE